MIDFSSLRYSGLEVVKFAEIAREKSFYSWLERELIFTDQVFRPPFSNIRYRRKFPLIEIYEAAMHEWAVHSGRMQQLVRDAWGARIDTLGSNAEEVRESFRRGWFSDFTSKDGDIYWAYDPKKQRLTVHKVVKDLVDELDSLGCVVFNTTKIGRRVHKNLLGAK